MPPTDGYSRLEKFKHYSMTQTQLNLRLKEIAGEMATLPKVPSHIDVWMGSFADLERKGFGLDTITKQMQIKREYSKLVDVSDTNLREMKILAIEDLLEKINSTLNKSELSPNENSTIE